MNFLPRSILSRMYAPNIFSYRPPKRIVDQRSSCFTSRQLALISSRPQTIASCRSQYDIKTVNYVAIIFLVSKFQPFRNSQPQPFMAVPLKNRNIVTRMVTSSSTFSIQNQSYSPGATNDFLQGKDVRQHYIQFNMGHVPSELHKRQLVFATPIRSQNRLPRSCRIISRRHKICQIQLPVFPPSLNKAYAHKGCILAIAHLRPLYRYASQLLVSAPTTTVSHPARQKTAEASRSQTQLNCWKISGCRS